MGRGYFPHRSEVGQVISQGGSIWEEEVAPQRVVMMPESQKEDLNSAASKKNCTRVTQTRKTLFKAHAKGERD